jgi:hypothetical protein
MRQEKSLRIGGHHANAVVWGPVYRTHRADALELSQRGRRQRDLVVPYEATSGWRRSKASEAEFKGVEVCRD